eukprot:GHUV01016434.1.p1 GENE.GHUV01016434.1~~GHUV01016434.1.p1  ORF type:complete len:195 (+),score=50.24 GHUV01016434.1:2362-2946(+)
MMLSGRVQVGAAQLQRRPQLPLRPLAERRQFTVSVQSLAHGSSPNPFQPSNSSSASASGSALPSNQPTYSTAPHLPAVPQPQQPQQEQWRLQAAAGDGSGSSGGSSGGGGGSDGGGGGSDDDEEGEVLDLAQVRCVSEPLTEPCIRRVDHINRPGSCIHSDSSYIKQSPKMHLCMSCSNGTAIVRAPGSCTSRI